MTQNNVSSSAVHKIAQLANIPITPEEEVTLSQAFNETLDVVAHMSTLDTSAVPATCQVTGLENILRADVIDETRMFSQAQALANAHTTYQGYFVVPQVIDQD